MLKFEKWDLIKRKIRFDDPVADLGIPTTDMIKKCIDEGKLDLAKELTDYIVPESKGLHDLYVDWCTDIFDKVGVIGVFPSTDDDLEEFKKIASDKYALFGNINNLEFGDWTTEIMEKVIIETIEIGKPNGRYVLATQHMIPHLVPIDKIAEFITIALKYAYY